MPDYQLNRNIGGEGPGGKVMHVTTQSLSNGDTYDTGLGGGVDQLVATSAGGNNNIVDHDGGDGSGTVTFGLIGDDGTNVTTDEDIDIIAVGSRK